ncbi:hypothetical protein T459_14610 [Capsicum annuum]|uniref:Uncharacterized protein n=1 Tax=Capsicum annuum TaxID=4072 RepID=A0A2G2ZI36_CAPAN|nr:hypothetical protein T459_14610 [Capsicum annuum]
MESRLVCELKMLKEGILALVSMQSGQATLPVAISNLIDASNTSDDAGPSSAVDTIMLKRAKSRQSEEVFDRGLERNSCSCTLMTNDWVLFQRPVVPVCGRLLRID